MSPTEMRPQRVESPARTRHAISLPRIARLSLKELRETLRDRRTIATLLLMPLLVYPLLSVAFQRFLVSNLKAIAPQGDYFLGFHNEADARQISDYLIAGDSLLEGRERPGSLRSRTLRPFGGATGKRDAKATDPQLLEPAAPMPTPVFVSDLRQSVIDGQVDVAIRILKSRPFPQGGKSQREIDCELIYDPQSAVSREVWRWAENCLRAVNEQSLKHQLRIHGVRSRVTPIVASAQPIETDANARPGGPSLATLVPLILILMTITGAVYPAIDLTAGERERGTLEMLVAAPVPRMQLLLAKYLAVLTVALLTAVVNLTAMMATVLSIGLGPVLFGEPGISPHVLLEIVALLVLFAGFFSAVLLAVTSFARSFKEAQAYLIPLMLASIAPGMLSMIPDLKLQGPLVVTPLVNIVLLARDLLQHSVEPATALWVVLSTALFALAAIGVAARIFGTDAILYGGYGTWSDLFRRPLHLAKTPTPTSALLCLAIIFPAYFLASNLLARAEVSIDSRLLLAALVTILVFFQIPLAAAVFNRVAISSGFQLRRAPFLVFAGAVVLGLSLWPFAHESLVLLKRWDWVSFDPRTLDAARQLIEKIQRVPPALLVGTLAIVPAACEEFFFRGYLLASLQKSLSGARAVLLSSVLFGVFHLVAIDQLHFERLVPSALLGLVLGWLCLRCGSVLPGMVLHATHNSFLLMAAYYQKELARWGWGLQESADIGEAGLPPLWLLVAAIGAALGFGIVQIATRRSQSLRSS